MSRSMLAAVLALSSLVRGAPALAHHAVESEYDTAKPITLTGVVTRVEWTNPHSHFYLDVKDASGKVTGWVCESSPPTLLRRGGLNRDMLPVGQTVTLDGYRAKDKSNLIWLFRWHLPNGDVLTINRPVGETDYEGK
jgi:hypothetical protein